MNGQIFFVKNRQAIVFVFLFLLLLSPLKLFADITDDPTLGTITGGVYNDANANGLLEPEEPGVAGVLITLSDGSNTQTQLTDVNGLYRFADLADGTYHLTQTDKEFYISMGDGDGEANGHNQIDNLLIARGNQITEQNFLDTIVSMSIGGLIFDDLDCDGQRSATEPGVDGIAVQLFQEDGTLQDETTSNEEGVYFFSDVEPGEYFMGFAVPENQVATMMDIGNDESLDSDVNPATGNTPVFELTTGQNVTQWDLGIASPARFEDIVWLDLDHDGIQDENEEGIASVTIHLHDGDTGDFLGTSITNIDGFFEFGGLPPGNYFLAFEPPAGFTFNPQDMSGIDNETGRTAPFELHLTGHDPEWEVGLRQAPTSIELLDFTATEQADGNQLVWRTGAEIDTFGFVLYRSTDSEFAHAVAIHPEPISSQSSESGPVVPPFDYQFLDSAALSTVGYTYWLVEVQTDSLTHRYGPVSIEKAGAMNVNQIFLPLIGP